MSLARQNALRLICFALVAVLVLPFLSFLPTSAFAAEGELDTLSVEGTAGAPLLASGTAGLLLNVESGDVLFSQQADAAVYPAATVKLMTALVAYEALSGRMDETVTLTAAMVEGVTGTTVGLAPGETVSVRDLFRCLLIAGGGDAGQALAVLSCQTVDFFVTAMNSRAAALGMTATRYENLTGIHHGSMVTTATDTGRLAAAFYGYPELTAISDAASATVTVSGRTTAINNRNDLCTNRYTAAYYREELCGLVFGSTYEAGSCLVAAASDGGLTYVAVVMGGGNRESTPNVYTDVIGLLDHALSGYGYRVLLRTGRIMAEIPVSLCKQADFVTVIPAQDFTYFLPLSADLETDVRFETVLQKTALTAPVTAGTEVGYVRILYLEEEIGRVALVTSSSLYKNLMMEFTHTLTDYLTRPFSIVLMILLVAGFVLLVLRKAHAEAVRREEEAEPSEELNGETADEEKEATEASQGEAAEASQGEAAEAPPDSNAATAETAEDGGEDKRN